MSVHPQDGQEVTLSMVMSHMQIGFTEMRTRFDGVDARFDRLEERVGNLEVDMKEVKGVLEAMNRKLNATEALEKSVNRDLEILEEEDLPRRVRRLEKHTGVC